MDKDDACPTVPGIPENNGCKGRDCSDVIKREQERLKKLQEEAKEINYNTLSDRIIKDIDFTLLKEKNIIYLVDYELLVCGTGLESSCGGYYEATPIYKNSDFWTEETIMKIYNKTKKNFILGMLFGGMGSGIEFENIPKDISNLNLKNRKTKIFKEGSENEVFMYYKANDTQPIKTLNGLLININKNDFEKKVNVEMLYTTYQNDITLNDNIHHFKRKYLIYQFINNQWELIETKQNF